MVMFGEVMTMLMMQKMSSLITTKASNCDTASASATNAGDSHSNDKR